jgi:uncharacterized protein (TIGR02145 family)
MAENLNYNTNNSKCYDNNESNCEKYGRLYNWETAKQACPAGWHLPSKTEWNVLSRFVGDGSVEGKFLKAKTGWSNSWNSNGNGQDKYGFTALPGGGSFNGDFSNAGSGGRWWSSSEDGSHDAYYRYMDYHEKALWYSRVKDYLHSVRCLQD